jgi:hypothetical protein
MGSEVIEETNQETPIDRFRRSAGFQIMFVLYSELEVGKAIDHLCASAEKFAAALREWQPIDTAPKGRKVLVLKGNGKFAIADWGRYCEYNGGNFTHWIPLPDPPTTEGNTNNQIERRKQ